MESYVVPGWPRAVLGHSAVVPHLNRLAGSGAQQYKDGVTGQPGTRQVPVGTAPFAPSPDQGDKALMGLGRWSDGPPYILPNLYYARPQREFWPGAGMPVSPASDNLMPVPATDPRGVPARLAFPAPYRWNKQTRWPGPRVAWPDV